MVGVKKNWVQSRNHATVSQVLEDLKRSLVPHCFVEIDLLFPMEFRFYFFRHGTRSEVPEVQEHHPRV